MPTITLIRHAESEANAGLPTESPASIRLTARGHQQAAEFAVQYDATPDLIIVSPFLRTQQTAVPLIARFPSIPVEEWPVHEFTYLISLKYAGTTETERGVFAHEYWQRCDPRWNDGGGAKSFADLIARIDDLKRRLCERRESNILVFTHGYFIKVLLLRREQASAPADAAFMAAFRDSRKNNPLPNMSIMHFHNSASLCNIQSHA